MLLLLKNFVGGLILLTQLETNTIIQKGGFHLTAKTNLSTTASLFGSIILK